MHLDDQNCLKSSWLFHCLLYLYYISSYKVSIVMKVKLYIDYISQPSRTVLAFAKISCLPVDVT